MGTGIVSIALSLDGHETLSRVLLVLDARHPGWRSRVLLPGARRARPRALSRPTRALPAALTSSRRHRRARHTADACSAGTGQASRCLLIALVWLGAARAGAAQLGDADRRRASFVAHRLHRVARGARRHARRRASTLAGCCSHSLAPFLLGLGFYAFVIARFDLRQLVVGRGDHWVTGGALAISTLAAGRITVAAKGLGVLGRRRTGRSKAVSVGLGR